MDDYEIIDGKRFEKKVSKYVEYKVIVDATINTMSADELESNLNSEGVDNWELVTVIGKNIVFKKNVENVDLYEV